MEVLLVEDSVCDIRLTKEALCEAELNLNLSVCRDGIAAMSFLKNEGIYINASRPDLILLDLNMPRMNGYEVLELVKSDFDLKSIPVIILSTTNNQDEVEKCYQNQANCFITKSSDFDQSVKSIKKFWASLCSLPNNPDQQLINKCF